MIMNKMKSVLYGCQGKNARTLGFQRKVCVCIIYLVIKHTETKESAVNILKKKENMNEKQSNWFETLLTSMAKKFAAVSSTERGNEE